MPTASTIKPKDRYGKLTVVSLTDNRIKGEYVWECICDCGNTRYRTTSKLKLGGACGCMIGKDFKHGMTGTPEHTAWTSMQNRCYNPKDDSYRYYGGKGITVCGEWLGPKGFQRFFACIGLRPSNKHSLDRYPNRHGNYEPGNVRWATPEEQQRNRSNNLFLTLNGVAKTQAEWAEITGWNKATFRYRRKKGWTDEEVLTTPLHVRLRK